MRQILALLPGHLLIHTYFWASGLSSSDNTRRKILSGSSEKWPGRFLTSQPGETIISVNTSTRRRRLPLSKHRDRHHTQPSIRRSVPAIELAWGHTNDACRLFIAFVAKVLHLYHRPASCHRSERTAYYSPSMAFLGNSTTVIVSDVKYRYQKNS